MKINTCTLSDLAYSILQYLAEKKYSNQTQEQYRGTYNQLLNYLVKKSIDVFDIQDCMLFINHHYSAGKPAVCRSHYTNLVRRISILFEFNKHRKIITKRFIPHKAKLTSLQETYEYYCKIQEQRGLAIKTMESKCSGTKKFLLFLESKSVKNISEMTVEDIYAFIDTKKDYAVSTKEYILYTLRDALKIFADNGLCDLSIRKLFPQISTHSESPIPSSFTPEELRKILSSVDRSSSIGKRDYAVLLLASFLGIRAGDIREMKLCYVKWHSDVIEFTQSKTGRFLQLPIPLEVKLALLDYLKNGRPTSDSEFIFIKHSAPYGAFASHNSLGYILKKYLEDIEINGRKKGLHSLRFSAAGNMLSNGTPITTICNVLGHCYLDTTNNYLKFDLCQLKKAALEVNVW